MRLVRKYLARMSKPQGSDVPVEGPKATTQFLGPAPAHATALARSVANVAPTDLINNAARLSVIIAST